MKLNRHSLEGYLKIAQNEYLAWIQSITSIIPGRIGMKIRASTIPFKSRGAGICIHEKCFFYHPNKISIGYNSRIGRESIFNGAAGLNIGKNVLIGPRVLIWTQAHSYNNPTELINSQGWKYAKVEIDDDVWVGANTTILMGVKIGEGAVVGAGAIVMRDVPPYNVFMGNPARKIGVRGNLGK